jgi:hypothetical protein
MHAQAPGHFKHLADYTHIRLVLNSLVGPGPQPGTQRLYASILGASKFYLLEIDPASGQVTVFDSPVDGEIVAWGMTVDVDGNIYLGTAPNARLMMFQVASGKIVDFGRAGPSEQWLWSLRRFDSLSLPFPCQSVQRAPPSIPIRFGRFESKKAAGPKSK